MNRRGQHHYVRVCVTGTRVPVSTCYGETLSGHSLFAHFFSIAFFQFLSFCTSRAEVVEHLYGPHTVQLTYFTTAQGLG